MQNLGFLPFCVPLVLVLKNPFPGCAEVPFPLMLGPEYNVYILVAVLLLLNRCMTDDMFVTLEADTERLCWLKRGEYHWVTHC